MTPRNRFWRAALIGTAAKDSNNIIVVAMATLRRLRIGEGHSCIEV
jgi:hypothetical protein